MKRIGSLALTALLGVAAWYAGPGLRVMQQQAFAQEIQEIQGSEGAYLLSYYDTSTAFGKSEGGYGGAGHSGGSGDALLRIVNAGNYEVTGGGGFRVTYARTSMCSTTSRKCRSAANAIYRPTPCGPFP